MDQAAAFEAERTRLRRIAGGILGDPVEAEDVVQQAWLRLDRTHETVDNLPGWLTTVVTRLCLDRLRARVPEPTDAAPSPPADATAADPAETVALADTVGVALQVVLERLSPAERVSFVLHDTFGFDFATIATMLDSTPVATRKLASRARSKVRSAAPDGAPAAWEVVDAFMDAARGGDLDGLLRLLAPDVLVTADARAVATGTPERLEGREAVAAMFDGGASAALPTLVDDRPGAAWYHRGRAMVLFDFTVEDGLVTGIVFRADPDVLARVVRRRDDAPA